MPYAVNNGVRIHFEVEGNGFPLVIQHGFTDSMETWYEIGYVDALKGKHQLILVDARGHGRSDKPHSTSAYGKKVHVEDILAVLHDLKIDRVDYWGFSMGARTGYAMAQYASQRIRSMILGGSGADGRSRIGSGSRKALKAGGAAAIAGLWGVAISESIRARLLANDVIALDACLVDEMGFAAVLPTMKMPCLLYVGSADPNFPAMQETAAEIPGRIGDETCRPPVRVAANSGRRQVSRRYTRAFRR